MFSKEVLAYQKRTGSKHPVFDLARPITPKEADDYINKAPWQIRLALAERTDYFIPDLFPKGLTYLMEHENSVKVIAGFFKRKDFATFHVTMANILHKHKDHPLLLRANEERLNFPITDQDYNKIIESDRYQLIRAVYEMKNLKLTNERIEYALTHIQDTVREAIAKRSDWTPTKEQAWRGLQDGEEIVVRAWLQRKDVSYTQPQLKEVFGDWKAGRMVKNYLRLSGIQRTIIELSSIKLDPECITDILKYNSLGVECLMKRNDIKYTNAQLKQGQSHSPKHISEYFYNQQNKQEREKLKQLFVQENTKPTPSAL